MRPARPTKPAAIPPTTTDVLVPPDGEAVALGVAETVGIVKLLATGRVKESVNTGTLLVGTTTGEKGIKLVVEELEVEEVVGVGIEMEVEVEVLIGVLEVEGVVEVGKGVVAAITTDVVGPLVWTGGGAIGPTADVDVSGPRSGFDAVDDGDVEGQLAVGLKRGAKPRRCRSPRPEISRA